MLRLGYIPIPRGCRPTPHFVPNARICRWVARPKGRVEKGRVIPAPLCCQVGCSVGFAGPGSG